MPAERMRYRSDTPDFAYAVVAGTPSRGFTGGIRKLAHRTKLVQRGKDFIHGDHDVGRPDAILFEGHELDEPNHHAFLAREAGELDDLVFVEPTQENAIHLYRLEPCA